MAPTSDRSRMLPQEGSIRAAAEVGTNGMGGDDAGFESLQEVSELSVREECTVLPEQDHGILEDRDRADLEDVFKIACPTWTLGDLDSTLQKLSAIGIRDVQALTDGLRNGEINDKLRRIKSRTFNSKTMLYLKRDLLGGTATRRFVAVHVKTSLQEVESRLRRSVEKLEQRLLEQQENCQRRMEGFDIQLRDIATKHQENETYCQRRMEGLDTQLRDIAAKHQENETYCQRRMEGLDTQLRDIAAKHQDGMDSSLMDRWERLALNVNIKMQEVDELKNRMETFDQQLGGLTHRMEMFEQQQVELEKQQHRTQEDIEDRLKRTVHRLEQNLAAAKEDMMITATDKRARDLEKMQHKLDRLERYIKNVDGHVAAGHAASGFSGKSRSHRQDQHRPRAGAFHGGRGLAMALDEDVESSIPDSFWEAMSSKDTGSSFIEILRPLLRKALHEEFLLIKNYLGYHSSIGDDTLSGSGDPAESVQSVQMYDRDFDSWSKCIKHNPELANEIYPEASRELRSGMCRPCTPPRHRATTGHCFLPKMLVRYPSCTKAIEDVQAGDRLMGFCEPLPEVRSCKRLTNATGNVITCVYRVDSEAGKDLESSFCVTADHPVPTWRQGDRKFVAAPAEDLRKGDRIGIFQLADTNVYKRVDAVIHAVSIEKLDTPVYQLELMNCNSTVLIAMPDQPADVFAEVYGEFAPWSRMEVKNRFEHNVESPELHQLPKQPQEQLPVVSHQDYVKVLEFRNFDGFKSLLSLEYLRKAGTGLDLVLENMLKAGKNADLTKYGFQSAAKMFVEPELVGSVIKALDRSLKPLNPRDVIVSRATEQKVLDTVRVLSKQRRKNWHTDYILDVMVCKHYYLSCNAPLELNQDSPPGLVFEGRVPCSQIAHPSVNVDKNTFLEVSDDNEDAPSVHTQSTTDKKRAPGERFSSKNPRLRQEPLALPLKMAPRPK